MSSNLKIRNSDGMALVLILMVLAIITAMVAEFAYGVYIRTNALHNWQTSQRLSLIAKSAVNLASETIAKNTSTYTYPGFLVISYKSPSEDFNETVSLRIEDENSKFNVNSLIYKDGLLNAEAYNSFVRLLKVLGLNPHIADRIVDWIDPDGKPRLQDSENISKNALLDSIDEMLVIPGIDRASYEKLSAYVTIYSKLYGTTTYGSKININGAKIPVLMSLSDSIGKEMAERIVKYRERLPFEKIQDIKKVAGFETIMPSLMERITVKGTTFRVISTATEGNIKRVIESIIEISDSGLFLRYWKEM